MKKKDKILIKKMCDFLTTINKECFNNNEKVNKNIQKIEDLLPGATPRGRNLKSSDK